MAEFGPSAQELATGNRWLSLAEPNLSICSLSMGSGQYTVQ